MNISELELLNARIEHGKGMIEDAIDVIRLKLEDIEGMTDKQKAAFDEYFSDLYFKLSLL